MTDTGSDRSDRDEGDYRSPPSRGNSPSDSWLGCAIPASTAGRSDDELRPAGRSSHPVATDVDVQGHEPRRASLLDTARAGAGEDAERFDWGRDRLLQQSTAAALESQSAPPRRPTRTHRTSSRRCCRRPASRGRCPAPSMRCLTAVSHRSSSMRAGVWSVARTEEAMRDSRRFLEESIVKAVRRIRTWSLSRLSSELRWRGGAHGGFGIRRHATC